MIKKILILVLFILAAIVAVYYGFVKKSPILTVNAPTSILETFSNSYVVGYEGDFKNITYRFSYPKDKFSLKSKVTFPSLVTIKNLSNEQINTVSFFYNGAAGFPSAKDFWDNQYETQCPDCLISPNSLSYPTNDMATYSNSTDEWVIFAQTPGFVIAHLKKPSAEALKIVQSLQVSASKASMPEFASVKVYFANDKIKPVKNCKEVVFIERQITVTPKVATAALELLFSGPTQDEEDSGYISEIPIGSDLNSVSIDSDGNAHADFNSLTESGGGSCSMAMRVAQIRQTLLQFPTVKNVTLSIEGQTEPIFQP
jgi:hypothetical protein